MMKILVTGSNGLLGQKLLYALRKQEHIELIATARGANRSKEKSGYTFESLDLTDESKVKDLVNKYRPDCVIHTAAMTNVDACELDPDACKKHNVDAVRYLLSPCKAIDTHFIYLSTDFVFDGENGPYDERDLTNPLSVYAHSKRDAELMVESSGLPFSIIRTMIIYGVVDDEQRSNVVLWTKKSLEAHKDINVINDQFRGPTLAEDLAEACISAAQKRALGYFHVSGREVMPIIDIAMAVADFFKLDKTHIHPVSTAQLNQPARRPLKTGFTIDKAEKELGYHPHSLQEGLQIIAEQLKNKNGKTF